jgi:excisionase family DNA binding protein
MESLSDSVRDCDPGPTTTAVLIDVEQFAELAGCSTRHIRRLADAGKCPPPVKLGSLVRWPRATVLSWIASGCPSCRTHRAGGAR